MIISKPSNRVLAETLLGPRSGLVGVTVSFGRGHNEDSSPSCLSIRGMGGGPGGVIFFFLIGAS